MNKFDFSLQEIVDVVGEWSDQEAINPEHQMLLAIFAAFADFYMRIEDGSDEVNRDLSALQVALEAAFQLGRTAPREPLRFEVG